MISVKDLGSLREISAKWRAHLIEKFSEINHKKWAPIYLITGTVALQYWYVKRQWRLVKR